MFNKFNKKIAAKIAVMSLAVASLTGAGIAFEGTVGPAEKAQAYTQNCRYIDAGYGRIIGGSPWPGYRYGVLCYNDYSWWEEVSFPWPRDGYNWQVWQNQYCAYPARNYVSC